MVSKSVGIGHVFQLLQFACKRTVERIVMKGGHFEKLIVNMIEGLTSRMDIV